MRVNDILTLLPHAEQLIAQYGLSCYSCASSAYENLEEGCRSHGMKDDVIDDLVTDLNELLAQRAPRPQTLTVTEAAARALGEILAREGKEGWGLQVGLDESGGFSMEFVADPSTGEKTFSNPAVPDVRLFASTATLEGIGGATVDLRDGRFKLDLPEDMQKKTCACANGGECACAKEGKEPGGCGCHS